MQQNRFKVGDYVWSNKWHMAVEILPEYDNSILFSCSLQAANKWTKVYRRLANGLEIFETLAHRERMEAKVEKFFNDLKDGKI